VAVELDRDDLGEVTVVAEAEDRAGLPEDVRVWRVVAPFAPRVDRIAEAHFGENR
jgi:hypothetical protein